MTNSFVLTRLAVIFCFAFTVFAVDLSAFNCTGNGTCLIEVDGVESECSADLELEWDTDYEDGFVEVDIVTYKSLTGDCFEASLEENTEARKSTISVTSDDGCSQFPARVSVRVYIRVNYEGKEYTSSDPVCLGPIDGGTVDSWPPDGTVTYEVKQNVTFTVEGGGDERLTIRAGSTLDVDAG